MRRAFAIDIQQISSAPNRQRQEFKEGDLADLADSIEQYGLIHAPVLSPEYRIVAGERRLRAMTILFSEGKSFKYGAETYDNTQSFVPVHIVDEDDPEILFAIELEENLRRVNLTPLEEAAAIAQLHRKRQAEQPLTFEGLGKGQTVKDTAKEVAALRGKEMGAQDEVRVAHSLIVDQFKDDPDVQAAAKVNLNKAAKIAKKKMEMDLVKAIGRAEGVQSAEQSDMKLIHGDSLKIVSEFEAKFFDALVFDPPYGMDAENFSDKAFALGHQYTDTKEKAEHFIIEILKQGTRILKDDSHILMFCAYEHILKWGNMLSSLDYWIWPRPLIWKKSRGHNRIPDYGPRYLYECIIFAGRGKRRINKSIGDVLDFAQVSEKMHAAEKPPELFAELLRFVGFPGDKILDPCCGVGPIFEGAKGQELKVWGIEQDENFYALAKEKI